MGPSDGAPFQHVFQDNPAEDIGLSRGGLTVIRCPLYRPQGNLVIGFPPGTLTAPPSTGTIT